MGSTQSIGKADELLQSTSQTGMLCCNTVISDNFGKTSQQYPAGGKRLLTPHEINHGAHLQQVTLGTSVHQAKDDKSLGLFVLQHEYTVASTQTGHLSITSLRLEMAWMDDMHQQHEELLQIALCTLNALSDLPMDLSPTHALKQGPS